MNLEAINKWLDEEYGCSYTRLEGLYELYFEKYCDLQQENKKQKEVIDKAIEWVKDWTQWKNDWFEEDSKPSELLDILKEASK